MILTNQNNHSAQPEESKQPAPETGNASNPSPQDKEISSTSSNQLLDERAEKYLRESASIEDLPDEQDQQDMDETIRNE